MPQIPMPIKTVIIWTDSLVNLSNARLESIISRTGSLERLIVILPELNVSSLSGKAEMFADSYHLLYDMYERILGSMTVEDGLRLDLVVLLYPSFCNLRAFQLNPAETRVFIIGEPDISLDELVVHEWIALTDDNHVNDAIDDSTKDKFGNIHAHNYDVVALGGTFDHLHAGHKIMLSSAMILARSQVVIGLTDSSMLKTKRHRERLYDYAQREKSVLQFMEAFSNDQAIKIEIVRLNDPFGPTITTPDIDLLVVSEETIPGANEINRIRASNGMKELEVVAVQFVKLSDQQRISSTLIRNLD